MAYDKLDLGKGVLPPWVNQTVALARPAVAAMTAAIPAAGAFAVGIVAFFSPARGMAMAEASTSFLSKIPEAGWLAIGSITIGYTVAKTVEARSSARAPDGRPSAESPVPEVVQS